jgi:HAMP domain-containing protein
VTKGEKIVTGGLALLAGLFIWKGRKATRNLADLNGQIDAGLWTATPVIEDPGSIEGEE